MPERERFVFPIDPRKFPADSPGVLWDATVAEPHDVGTARASRREDSVEVPPDQLDRHGRTTWQTDGWGPGW